LLADEVRVEFSVFHEQDLSSLERGAAVAAATVGQKLVPAGHVAHFVRETVREEVDLSAILSSYTEERGYPPYHPAMMVACCCMCTAAGVYSSRRIAQASEERVDFMAVTALNKPDLALRGLEQARGEWAMICTAHNLLKLASATG
jgi:hypothetical protein